MTARRAVDRAHRGFSRRRCVTRYNRHHHSSCDAGGSVRRRSRASVSSRDGGIWSSASFSRVTPRERGRLEVSMKKTIGLVTLVFGLAGAAPVAAQSASHLPVTGYPASRLMRVPIGGGQPQLIVELPGRFLGASWAVLFTVWGERRARKSPQRSRRTGAGWPINRTSLAGRRSMSNRIRGQADGRSSRPTGALNRSGLASETNCSIAMLRR